MNQLLGYCRRATLAILMVTASLSHALVVTDTTSFNTGNVYTSTANSTHPTSSSNTGYAYTSLSGFDSSLGKLTGVSISYDTSAYIRSSIAVRDPSDCWLLCEDNVSGGGYVRGTFNLDLYDPNLGFNPSTSRTSSVHCSDNDGFCARTTSTYANYLDGILFSTTDESLLSLFLDETLNFRAGTTTTAATTYCHDTEDTCRTYGETRFWGNLVVDYTYDEVSVPEPATLGLFALGLLGFGLRRKR